MERATEPSGGLGRNGGLLRQRGKPVSRWWGSAKQQGVAGGIQSVDDGL